MNPPTTIAETEFIAFDLETTGLHPIASQIVEIGAVRFRGDGTVLGNLQQLINPQCDIPPNVTRIHGITNSMVRRQPVLAEVLPRFLEFLSDTPAVLLAHNAGFDVGFISVAVSRHGHASPSHPVLDTCALARRRINLPNYRLETIGRYLRLINKEKHRALDDAILVKDVFAHLIRERPAIRQTQQLFELVARIAFDSIAVVLKTAPTGYEDLWSAIDEGRQVAINYLGGSTPGVARVITPHGVTEMRGQMYLSAYCHEGGCEKTFRLDRINSYKLLKQ